MNLCFATTEDDSAVHGPTLYLPLGPGKMPRADAAVRPSIHHIFMLIEVLAVDDRGVLAQVLRCRAEDQALLTDRLVREQIRELINAADSHGQIDTFFNDIDEAIRERGMQPQPWVVFGEIEQKRHHMLAAEGYGDIDAQASRRLLAFGGQNGLGLFEFGQDPGAGEVESIARIGQVETACGALEQTCSQPGFQACDTFADRRCCQVELGGGGGETAGICRCYKNFDAFEVLCKPHCRSLNGASMYFGGAGIISWNADPLQSHSEARGVASMQVCNGWG